MCFEPIRFYDAHGVSFGGTEVQARKGHAAVFFTNRPIAPRERLTLGIHDDVIRSIVRIGFTDRDPKTLQGKLLKTLPCGFDEETGIWGPVFGDGGWVKGDTSSLIYFEEATNRILIEERGFGWREIISGFRVRKPVYVVFNVWLGTPRICITSRIDSEYRSKPINLQPKPSRFGGYRAIVSRVRSESTRLPRATDTHTILTERFRRADSCPDPVPADLGTLQSFMEGQSQMVELTGSRPIHPGTFFYPGESAAFNNFLLRPARLTFPGSSDLDSRPNPPTVNEALPRSGNFVFIDTPLKANHALIVKLTALKRAKPIQIVLTVENADRVYSCGSLLELCNTSYSLRMESEIPQAGDELAVKILPSGAVHISHNNRGWKERMHVDTELKYHVVFDMEHVSRLSMIGITNGLREIKGGSDNMPTTPPQEPRNGAHSFCVVCLENAVDVAIIPCGHVVLCEGCARALLDADPPMCPYCRGSMTNIMKLYFA